MEISSSDLIWGVLWAAELGWAWRIQQLGLRGRYPMLFAYLIVSAAHSVLSTVVISRWGWVSGWFWAASYPVLWALMLLLVLEAGGRNRLRGILVLGIIWAFIKLAGWTPHDQELIIYGVLAAVTLVSLIRIATRDRCFFTGTNPLTVLGLFASLFLFEVAVLCLPHGAMELAMRYTALPVFYAGLMIRGVWSFRQESSSPPCPGPN